MKRIGIAAALLLLVACAGTAEATVRCMTREIDPNRAMLRPVPPAEMVRTHNAGQPMTPPENPDVGDSWLWYTWRLNGPPTPELKMCTVRGEGTNVYVVVEDSQWQTRVFQNDVDAVVNAWDNASQGIHPDQGIYPLDTNIFGPAPDMLDHDPKIYVLFYDFDIAADGFFWAFDEYPDGSQQYASNECEVIYMNSSDNDPGGTYLISVMAHEFEHMIHWYADEDEAAWVDEGMAELAMWFFGYPDQIVGFPANPDNDLTGWTGIFADYVKTYLWSLYFYEQYGGEPTVWAVVHEPANSVTGYENVLDQIGSSMGFNDVYADWVVANYLDDTAFDHGQFGYIGATLPAFYAVVKNTYPVPPTNGSVYRYAADYVKFINGIPQRLRFDGNDAGVWRPRVLFKNGATTLDVVDMSLDAVDFGTVDLFDFGQDYDTVILVVAKTSPSSATSYQYGTEGIPAGVPDGLAASVLRLHAGEPNPMRAGGVIRLDLNRAQQVSVSVVDLSGRVVRNLGSGRYEAGVHPFRWDGRNEQGLDLPAGVYFVRARAEDGTAASRWLRVR